MNELISQQLKLWQLSLHTSVSCWQSMSMRSALFVSKSPFDPILIEETKVIFSEKIELANHITKSTSVSDVNFDPLQSYSDTLKMINDKAAANVTRLREHGDA